MIMSTQQSEEDMTENTSKSMQTSMHLHDSASTSGDQHNNTIAKTATANTDTSMSERHVFFILQRSATQIMSTQQNKEDTTENTSKSMQTSSEATSATTMRLHDSASISGRSQDIPIATGTKSIKDAVKHQLLQHIATQNANMRMK